MILDSQDQQIRRGSIVHHCFDERYEVPGVVLEISSRGELTIDWGQYGIQHQHANTLIVRGHKQQGPISPIFRKEQG